MSTVGKCYMELCEDSVAVSIDVKLNTF